MSSSTIITVLPSRPSRSPVASRAPSVVSGGALSRARLRSSQKTRGLRDQAERVAVPLSLYLTWLAAFPESLRRAINLNDSAAIAPSLVAIGAGFYRTQQFDSANVYLERGKLLASRIGDFRTLGNALGILASVSKDQGKAARAVDLYKRASATRARSGDTRGIAADQNNLGLMALERGDVDAVVVVGCVIQGETGHDEVITHAAAQTLLALACNSGKPVGLGVTGPRMTHAQAEARIGAAAFAVARVVAQHRLLKTA